MKSISDFIASWIFKDVIIDEMKIKHLEIKSKNTLTTPKIVLSDAAANPTINGEIQMNGTTIKGYSGGALKNW